MKAKHRPMSFFYHLRKTAIGDWRGYWVMRRGGKDVRHTPKYAVDCPGQPAD